MSELVNPNDFLICLKRIPILRISFGKTSLAELFVLGFLTCVESQKK